MDNSSYFEHLWTLGTWAFVGAGHLWVLGICGHWASVCLGSAVVSEVVNDVQFILVESSAEFK